MEEHEIPQMIISDPVAIFYLTGKWIFPGERLLALYLNVNGNHKMMINKLFPQESDLGVDIIYYDDIEDGVEILSKYVEKDKTMGKMCIRDSTGSKPVSSYLHRSEEKDLCR